MMSWRYDFGLDDREAVARAYNAVRRTGQPDLPAYRAALAVYRERYRNVPERDAGREVGWLIYSASVEIPDVIFEGMGSGPTPRRKPDGDKAEAMRAMSSGSNR